jgi:hypothetical protein
MHTVHPTSVAKELRNIIAVNLQCIPSPKPWSPVSISLLFTLAVGS